MKKISLMMFALLLVPSLLNAQAWPAVARADATQKRINQAAADAIVEKGQEVKNFCKDCVEGFEWPGWPIPSNPEEQSLFDKMLNGALEDEIKNSTWYRSYQARKYEMDRQDAHAEAAWRDYVNGRTRIYDIKIPDSGIFKFIYDKTEEALEDHSHNGYHRKSPKMGPLATIIKDVVAPDGYVTLPDTPKSQMYAYAYQSALQARQIVLDELQKDPFGSFDQVEAFGMLPDTRRAYEIRHEIVVCGGLNACIAEVLEKYGEDMVVEYENLFKVREDWLHYQEQNPLFSLYTITGNFEDLKLLNKKDYERLADFFLGKEPAEGWYYEYREDLDFLTNPSPLTKGRGGAHGCDITLHISDNLEISITPPTLTIHIRNTAPQIFSMRTFEQWIEDTYDEGMQNLIFNAPDFTRTVKQPTRGFMTLLRVINDKRQEAIRQAQEGYARYQEYYNKDVQNKIDKSYKYKSWKNTKNIEAEI